jgi:D-alanyl-D-alanine-carboxypeptidase/D-alanyl-D-alanine-endopeptidase
VNWRATAADWLARTLEPTLPGTAVLAAVTADDGGYAVKLSDSCPLNGRFEIGSITKTMTGTVLAALAHARVVDLTDEIGRWTDAGRNSGITLIQLATHTSGLPRLAPGRQRADADPYAYLTPEVAERELRAVRRRPGGQDWNYSNFGFQVLSLALERAANAPFPVLLQRHVFDPLAMTCSGVAGYGDGDRLQGHLHGRPVGGWTFRLWGAGGVEASAEDMARYLAACLRPPDSPVGRAIQLTQRAFHSIDSQRASGLGWVIGPPGYLGHDGGTAGFRSMLGLRLPAGRAAAVFASDRAARGLGPAVRESLDRDPP